MKTEVLDKCARVLNYWNEYDEQLISLIEDTNTDFIKGFVEPFRRELIENLLSKASFQEKKELIMFYIDELHRAALVQEDYKSIGRILAAHPKSGGIFPKELENGAWVP